MRMKRFWLAVEVAAYVVFSLDILLIWASMFGDYHRIGYDVPGGLALPICVIVAGIARDKRGGAPHDIY